MIENGSYIRPSWYTLYPSLRQSHPFKIPLPTASNPTFQHHPFLSSASILLLFYSASVSYLALLTAGSVSVHLIFHLELIFLLHNRYTDIVLGSVSTSFDQYSYTKFFYSISVAEVLQHDETFAGWIEASKVSKTWEVSKPGKNHALVIDGLWSHYYWSSRWVVYDTKEINHQGRWWPLWTALGGTKSFCWFTKRGFWLMTLCWSFWWTVIISSMYNLN
jgi:hypothetical protein